MEITFENALKGIRSKQYMPVYLLHGAEPYFIDHIVDLLEDKVLTEAEKAFNASILYGRDVQSKSVLDHARQFPMMSEKRLVIIKEAQSMRDIKSLESYFNQPSESTVLAIAYKKKADGRASWLKTAKKSSDIAVVQSDPIPEYKIASWLQGYIKSIGLTIAPDALNMMILYLGSDLKKLTNEIEKVRLNMEGKEIDVSLIEKYIGISRDFDVYALLRAISEGNKAKAQNIANNLEENQKTQPLQLIIPGIATYFEKVIVVAQNFKKDDRTLASMIGTYPSFIKEYRQMAKRYNYHTLRKIYSQLVKADGYSKGLDRKNSTGILKELVGNILLYQRALVR